MGYSFRGWTPAAGNRIALILIIYDSFYSNITWNGAIIKWREFWANNTSGSSYMYGASFLTLDGPLTYILFVEM